MLLLSLNICLLILTTIISESECLETYPSKKCGSRLRDLASPSASTYEITDSRSFPWITKMGL
ncbi:Uncharacterized protein FKW44_012283 [Caligus rogercresseyi]|uniref:Uncharacterized protein n=1 Tax=Caligus rogercresseyi TaxID=217165 RepID=A0A7T8K9F4_CALRO|nr:Uncharacterized protein FKW44_012283 [Caligus rogercresseyi]